MDAIVALQPCGSTGCGRIHQRFYAFATRSDESFLNRAGFEKCPRGSGCVKSTISGFRFSYSCSYSYFYLVFDEQGAHESFDNPLSTAQRAIAYQ
jgi:hypothetical protein